MRKKHLLLVFIVSTAIFRLIFAAFMTIGNDEAYYAQLAAHPDWSYFDHPPMLALLAALGAAIGGEGSALAVRSGFVVLFAFSTWLMFRFASRIYGETAGLIAAILLNATAYFGLAVGTFLLPDGPLLFFLLIALDRLAVAVEEPERLGVWIGLGAAWGGAMLSKYSAVFLAVGALGFLLTDHQGRQTLLRPGPYVAAALGLAIFSPVVFWNAAHEWISFAFQGGRAIGASFRPLGLLASLAGQIAYVTPWVWAFLMMALWRAGRRRDRTDRLLLWQALPPLIAFLVVALRREVLPHWSLMGLVPVFPLLGWEWAEKRSTPRRLAVFSAVPVVMALVIGSQARWGWIPVESDPTTDGAGWNELLAEIDRLGLRTEPVSFLFTSTWYDSGQLAFAAKGKYPVLCYAPRGGHNFDLWNQSRGMVGKTGLLVVVGERSTEPGMYDRWFETIEPVGDVEIDMGKRRSKTVHLYRCRGQTMPFPPDSTMGHRDVLTRTPRGDSRVR